MFVYGSVLAASNYSSLYKGLYFVLTDKSEARGRGTIETILLIQVWGWKANKSAADAKKFSKIKDRV